MDIANRAYEETQNDHTYMCQKDNNTDKQTTNKQDPHKQAHKQSMDRSIFKAVAAMKYGTQGSRVARMRCGAVWRW
jgi:hypothetical protein